jgi:hypothetical protein
MRWLSPLLLVLAAPAWAADVAVVCPDGLRDALRPWVEYRAKQGYSVQFLEARGTAAEIQAAIRERARQKPLSCVLLVGDAAPNRPPANRPLLGGGPRDPLAATPVAFTTKPEWCVPTGLVDAKIIRNFGPDRDIATDNGYADLDGDGVPDVPVGRLTADTPEELATIVRKIIDYERRERQGEWCRRINLVAGVGGFGMLADAAIETCAKHFLTSGIPAAYGTTLTQASWQSAYCPDPRLFQQCTVDRLNEGSLFFVYMGHGDRRLLDSMHAPGRQFPIFACPDVPKLKCRQGPPIAVFLACYTGAFDQPLDCLAEDLLRQEGGPVAVLAGSRMTMPYAMGVMGLEMMRQTFIERRETIGEIMLEAKRRLVSGRRDDTDSKTIDWLAGTLGSHSDLAGERAEHVLLFNLLGDPLLRVPQSRELKLGVPPRATAGGQIDVAGESTIAGRCTVELVVRRDRLTFSPPIRTKFELTEAAEREYDETYRRANDPRLDSVRLTVPAGKFAATLRVPDSASGACHVRVVVEGNGDTGVAFSAADVEISRPAR